MPPTKPHPWREIALAWSCVGVALVVQAWAVIPPGMTPGFVLWVLGQQAARAVFWALLTPWVIRAGERWPLGGPGRYAHGLMHLGLGVAGMAAFYLLRVPVYFYRNHLSPVDHWRDIFSGGFNGRNFIDVVLYWTILAVGWILAVHRQRRELALREAQLEAQLVEAQLAALKQQVQPHFLFNSLNAISALMRDGEKDKAVETLAQLSGLLRRLMGSASRPEVELQQELDYIQGYLAIEKVRFEERLGTELNADEECLHALVPTLILQPLVENAIKHGIARRRAPGQVRVLARRHEDMLRLEVWNDPAETAPGRPASENHGLGLTATRARLERAYGQRYRLEQTIAGPHGTVVALELPLKYSHPAPLSA